MVIKEKLMNRNHLVFTLALMSVPAATYTVCPYREMQETLAAFDQLFCVCFDEDRTICYTKPTKRLEPEITEEKEQVVVQCSLGELPTAEKEATKSDEPTKSGSDEIQATIDDEGVKIEIPSLGKTVDISSNRWNGVTYLTVKVQEELIKKADGMQQKSIGRTDKSIGLASAVDMEQSKITVEKDSLKITVPKKVAKKIGLSLKQEIQPKSEVTKE
jgi:hypothetical protein